MRTPSRSLTAAAAAAVVVATAILAAASGTAASTPTGATTKSNATACRGIEQLVVPGAEKLTSACLSDLTTTGTVVTGHTDASSFLGFGGLSVAGTAKPACRPRDPARRLLPRHLDPQHPARLEPRLPVRDPPAPQVERRTRRRRTARNSSSVRQRRDHLRHGPGQGVRLRLHRQGQQRTGGLHRRRQPR